MPRKNTKDSAVVASFLQKQRWFIEGGWSIVPIDGLPQEEVAGILQKSLIYLAFGHPEGFGLPLAEAAACGCYLIGYSGLGGRELLEHASKHRAGVEIGYGNWLGFVHACREFDRIVNTEPKELSKRLLENSKSIRQIYNTVEMINSISNALYRWEEQLK